MSTHLKRRRSDDGRSGPRKMLRGRPAASPASPYRSPDEPADPPPAAQPGDGGGWLSSLVSGAGKLVSAVFGSDSDSDSSSSSSSSSETDYNSNEDADAGVAREEHEELSEKTKTTKLVTDWQEGSIAIFTEVETKSAIEQLLLQETFTRDECNKLTKIIQSRVVDAQSAEFDQHCEPKELPDMAAREVTACARGFQCSHQSRDLRETTYSQSILNALSPGSSSTYQAVSDAMEAKNYWLDSKKSSSSVRTPIDLGPSTLNTNMLQSDFEGVISPVDVAKSYMRSLPSCQPPASTNNMFSASPSSRMHLCMDGTTFATAYHSLPSSKVLKRNYLASSPGHTFDEARRVRFKYTENIASGFLKPGTCIVPSESDKRALEVLGINHNSNYSLAAYGLDSGSTLPEALHADDNSAARALRQSDKRPLELVNLLAVSNAPSASDAEAAIEVKPIHISMLSALSSEPTHSRVGGYSHFSDPLSLLPNEKQDVGENLMTMEQLNSISVPFESHVMASTEMENDGDHKQAVLYSEQPAIADEVIKSVLSSSLGLDIDPCAALKEGPCSTRTIKEEPVEGNYQETQATPCETATNSFVNGTNSPRVQQSGIMLKANVMIPVETQARTGQSQERNASARPRRGRGRIR